MAGALASERVALHQRLLHGIAEASRLRILTALHRDGELRVSDVVDQTGLSQPNVSKHLICLWECGLVAREPRGREVFYRPIAAVADLFAAIDRVLGEAGETIGACAITAELVSEKVTVGR